MDALLQINDILGHLNNEVEKCDGFMSLSEWRQPEDTPEGTILPPLLRYGKIHLDDYQSFPLLLPTNVNAVMMNLCDRDKKVPCLFQNIIMRALLTLRMDLVKVTVVDKDMGRSFPLVGGMRNPLFRKQVVSKSEDIRSLINGLESEIKDAYALFGVKYKAIDGYNYDNEQTPLPYHFVIIDDFPYGFSNETIKNLLNVISNGNASMAGIKIFINYCQQQMEEAPREFDLRRFEALCSCVTIRNEALTFDNWPFELFIDAKLSLELDLAKGVGQVAEYLENIKPIDVPYSLDWWFEDMKKKNAVWSASTIEGIRVPVGIKPNGDLFEFYMANDKDDYCDDYCAMIAGLPKGGKSVLLDNIIVNAAMKYSPDELWLYLADFSNGVGFAKYRKLPHVKALMLDNNREYALRIFKQLEKEWNVRSQRFRQVEDESIEKLSSFREFTGESMPRILFIIDECQFLFPRGTESNEERTKKLNEIVKQGRKYGISIILSTQTIEGVDLKEAEDVVSYRFSFKLPGGQSGYILRNNSAASLEGKPKGTAIMNNSTDGRKEANVEFRAAFTKKYKDHVEYLASLYKEKYGREYVIPYICEVGSKADIVDNVILAEYFNGKLPKPNHLECDVFLGKPDFIRPMPTDLRPAPFKDVETLLHTRIRYRRQIHSNTLILGDDFNALIKDIAIQLLQLKWLSHSDSRFFVADCSNVMQDKAQVALSEFGSKDGFMIGDSLNFGNYLDEMSKELERRKVEQRERKTTVARMVLVVLNVQNCEDLRFALNQYNRGEQTEMNKKLVTVLSEGPQLGIHCIIHGFSYERVFDGNNGILLPNQFSLFENRIYLKGAGIEQRYQTGIGKPKTIVRNGWMMVENNNLDDEPYEECNAYSAYTINEEGGTNEYVKLVSELFKKYH